MWILYCCKHKLSKKYWNIYALDKLNLKFYYSSRWVSRNRGRNEKVLMEKSETVFPGKFKISFSCQTQQLIVVMPVGEPIYCLVVSKTHRVQKSPKQCKNLLQAISQHTLVMRWSITVDKKNIDTLVFQTDFFFFSR